jgi:hypothetical protein
MVVSSGFLKHFVFFFLLLVVEFILLERQEWDGWLGLHLKGLWNLLFTKFGELEICTIGINWYQTYIFPIHQIPWILNVVDLLNSDASHPSHSEWIRWKIHHTIQNSSVLVNSWDQTLHNTMREYHYTQTHHETAQSNSNIALTSLDINTYTNIHMLYTL